MPVKPRPRGTAEQRQLRAQDAVLSHLHKAVTNLQQRVTDLELAPTRTITSFAAPTTTSTQPRWQFWKR